MSNLFLYNSNFVSGAHFQNGIQELNVPNDWHFWYKPREERFLERQDHPWGRPRVVIHDRPTVAAGGQRYDQFPDAPTVFKFGEYAVEVFGQWNPIWAGLEQFVADPVAASAREKLILSANFFPNIWNGWVAGESRGWYPYSEVLASEVRLYAAQDLGVMEYVWRTDWRLAGYGEWQSLSLDITPVSWMKHDFRVGIEMRCRWANEGNSWIIGGLSLE